MAKQNTNSKAVKKITEKLDKADAELLAMQEDEIIREMHMRSAIEWAKQHEAETGIKYIIKSRT